MDLVIDPRLRGCSLTGSTMAGIVRHTFVVPVGDALASALDHTVRAAFEEAVMAETPSGRRPILRLELSGEPTLSVQWYQGLIFVGQYTDCLLAVAASLTGPEGDLVWGTVVPATRRHETAALVNWPTAGQAEPACRLAIEALADELGRRLVNAGEIRAYAERGAPH